MTERRSSADEDKLDADQQAYAKNCKDRRYDEKDFNALKAAK